METSKPDNKPLYNSRIIDTYIKLIKRKYSYINIDELLSYAGMELYQVSDEGHWFTQKQIDLFYDRLVYLTGNKDIAREAGRFGASPDAIGVFRQIVLSHIGPAKAYEIIGKAAANFTKSAVYDSKRIDTNKVEIIVTPLEGVCEKPFQCKNRIGYFECVSAMFNCRMPKIEHPECIFEGGSVCRYIVSWEESHFAFWEKIRNYTTLLLSPSCMCSFFINPQITITAILPITIFVVLSLTLYSKVMEKKELNTAIDNLRDSPDKLLEQINMNYNNALMINEIGLAISKQMDINGILMNITEVLRKRLDYDRGVVLLSNQDKSRLQFRAGFGYTDEQLDFLRNTSFHLDNPKSKGVFTIAFRKQQPLIVNDIDEIKDNLTPRSLTFAKTLGVKSFICCPIIYEKESLGVLAVDNVKTKRPLIQSDANLLMGIAPGIGISIHNSMLIEARERQFKSIMQVLAASIDARDALTAGHSEKVTEYALGICNELGVSKDYCEVIRFAALLHDYGKIGIEDSILKKRGKLNPDERIEIETHAEKTKKILEQIHFEGIYREVPDIAGSHHERIDGSGYPKGLKEEEIPLGAKIIGVADFFEAITSKRHYRDPMPLDTAFQLLKDEGHTRFDKNVVEAFIRYYSKKYNWDPAPMVLQC
ncbi:MAG: HD domain-containing protein [Planctomycetia bacterium]|jgi:HD-GYP domain-containing protein (c-di-GMP phosphodiesterase class II)|nr:HD domain-containing protein [Candidatus Brocadia sp.]OQZ03351.1 MAG: phosphohydrolase [Candidatus Brocadia sp. UTAMX1]QOJ07400.1 MAG: HD domain-containing protein [Planctomycetia bacterium]TVL95107.1 MAG: phosphohydrolase [Candidatus Brocadia sp. BL1]HQU30855.1 HD domain-containing phosphohydrolase [Candidatus Brocadia sapporoensis]